MGQAQLLRYQVFKSKKEIGTMTVSRVSSLSEVTYENITEVRYKILIELEIKYLLQETFEQGVLMRGHGFSSLNGPKIFPNVYPLKQLFIPPLKSILKNLGISRPYSLNIL
jgi:hypothetical protein